MPVSQVLSPKGTIKRITNNDTPFSPSQPVISSFYATSTASQTVINLGFSIQTTGVFANTDVLWLFVDGKKLDLGSSNDYTFTSVGSDGTSSQVTLNSPIVANLNIQAFKLGLKPEIQFTMDNRFTQLYAGNASGFQAWVSQTDSLLTATTTTGTPAAGTFYSTITNRAPIVDLTQDLKPRMGIERIMTQTIQLLQTEFGPSGQQVFSNTNDTFGQMRWVGNWTTEDSNQGQDAIANTTTSTAGDYVEITFYGTGLNFLMFRDAGTRDHRVSVDGGAEGGNIYTAGPSSTNGLSQRNYSSNQVTNVATGLTLGVHTVKIRNNASANDMRVFGFEILNESSNVVTNPGIFYSQAQKFQIAAQSSLAYNAAVTGTTGGRVLHYASSSGISQVFTACATSPLYLTSANHTTEEVARSYYPREFGAGTTTDFSGQSANSSGGYAFTADDGTTILFGSSVSIQTEGLNIAGSGSYAQFAFIGTGLDWAEISNGTSDTHNVTIDGVSAGSITSAAVTQGQVRTIVSGLPYGSHVMRITRPTATLGSIIIKKFIVYQPKKPTLPAGAIELGDYNVLGNYVNNSTSSTSTISTGVMRKALAARESSLSNTGWTSVIGVDVTNFCSGYNTQTVTSGSSFSYTFFGTGFDYRFSHNGPTTQNFTISVDGSSNFTTSNGSHWTGALTVNTHISGTFTSSTGVYNDTTAGLTTGLGISLSGMTLGTHVVTVTSNGTGNVYPDCMDIITPIHSFKSNIYADIQNALQVGSNAISDNRKITPVKDILPVTKAWAQATGVTSGPTTTSSSLVPMPDMSCTVKTTGGPLRISYSVQTENSATNANFFQIYVDGIAQSASKNFREASAAFGVISADVLKVPAAAGFHKVDLYWSTNGGTMTGDSTSRTLIVEET